MDRSQKSREEKMQNRLCDMCGMCINELGVSPWCNYCGKVMCPTCERKHNKEECRNDQELKKK